MANTFFQIPEFCSHRLLRGGHLQTLAGAYLPSQRIPYSAKQHRVELPDGDVLIVHDDQPTHWEARNGIAVLVHGLCGSHLSPYLTRIGFQLNSLGIRTVRIDLRGCGAGIGLARNPYHAGRSEDLAAVLDEVTKWAPLAPIAVAGFSLGGNITLKYLAEQGEGLPSPVAGGIAVNPPIDLNRCVSSLTGPLQKRYDRYFVKLLMQQVRLGPVGLPEDLKLKAPRSLYEFDDRYTAPVAGFGSASNYYSLCSSKPRLTQIACPALIIMSNDDPLIPADVFESLEIPDHVTLHLAASGGHLGYLSDGGIDPDRRWMDRRVTEGIVRLFDHHSERQGSVTDSVLAK